MHSGIVDLSVFFVWDLISGRFLEFFWFCSCASWCSQHKMMASKMGTITWNKDRMQHGFSWLKGANRSIQHDITKSKFRSQQIPSQELLWHTCGRCLPQKSWNSRAAKSAVCDPVECLFSPTTGEPNQKLIWNDIRMFCKESCWSKRSLESLPRPYSLTHRRTHLIP